MTTILIADDPRYGDTTAFTGTPFETHSAPCGA